MALVEERSGFSPKGHSGKALAHVLETYPRDELLQTPTDQLLATVGEILHLQDRQKLRLFVRSDAYARFASCLVYVPRDRYNTAFRERIQRLLEEALGGTESEFQAQLDKSTLARLLFTIRTPSGMPADFDAEALERRLSAAQFAVAPVRAGGDRGQRAEPGEVGQPATASCRRGATTTRRRSTRPACTARPGG